MNYKLKHCPFCGGEADIECRSDEDGDQFSTDEVWCKWATGESCPHLDQDPCPCEECAAEWLRQEAKE